jgi:hypothetical protein
MPYPSDFTDGDPSGPKVDSAWLETVQTKIAALETDMPDKYEKPGTGIPEADLSSGVQAKLNTVGGAPAKARTFGSMWRPPQGTFPVAELAVAATVTTIAPTYSSPTTYRWDTDATRFRIGGNLVANNQSSINCGVNNISGADETSMYCWTGFEVEFWVRGPDCTVILRNFSQGDYKIMVDDQLITSGFPRLPSSTGLKYIQLKFNSQANIDAADVRHKVRVICGHQGFVGVMVPGSAQVFAAEPRHKAAITGDSWVQGPGLLASGGPIMAAPAGELAVRTGWEWWNLGQGTTGYIDDGSGGNRTRFGSSARLTKLNSITNLEAIIIMGGGNDTSEVPADVAAAANTMWNAIAASQPQALLIVTGMQCPNLVGTPTQMTNVNTALKNAALANPNVDYFVNMREPDMWITDTTKDMHIVPETPVSIHPSLSGYSLVMNRLLDEVSDVLMP